ncbi:MAG: polysaccharide deacetylase family protein [Elusimicrobia bacterium]|nr:polysaccharide deacetylase family protein [Elusimicrobiota bacterium]
MAELSGININFDSLGYALSLDPRQNRDPSYFEVADRFLDLADRHGFRYTIFVIGQDLENPEVAVRVREWHQRGHEVGNHSYSHPHNLGSLGRSAIEREVMKSHELIFNACGREPRGFIAPGWATSTDLLDVLIEHRYLYDTSLLPSCFMWLASAKVYWNYRDHERRRSVLQRRDWLANLVGSREPFLTDGKSLVRRCEKGLVVLPLPATPVLRLPLWHSMSFVFPIKLFEYVLVSTLGMRYFYYLLHPSDLAGLEDIPPGYAARSRAQDPGRMAVPLEQRTRHLDEILGEIKRRSRKMVTLETMAESFLAEQASARA